MRSFVQSAESVEMGSYRTSSDALRCVAPMVSTTVPDRLAKEIAEWAEEQTSLWPDAPEMTRGFAQLVKDIDVALAS